MRTIARVPSRQLWQHRVYLDLHPLHAFVPVESVIRDRQKASYAALREAGRSGDASPFLAFSLEATHDALNELAAELRPEPATAASRLARARSHFGAATSARASNAAFSSAPRHKRRRATALCRTHARSRAQTSLQLERAQRKPVQSTLLGTPRSTPISARGPSQNGMRRLRFTWAPRSARLAP